MYLRYVRSQTGGTVTLLDGTKIGPFPVLIDIATTAAMSALQQGLIVQIDDNTAELVIDLSRNMVSNSQQVTLLDAASVSGAGSDQIIGGYKTLTFEVFGTAASFTVQIEGKSISGAIYLLQSINLNTMTNSTSMSSTGLYQIDVTGLVSVHANLTTVSGGNITVQGKLVA